MTFTFNGQEFDVNKRIFVLGYTIKNTWFPYRDIDPVYQSFCAEYGPIVKSFYVRSILFDTKMIDGRMQNAVTELKFDFDSGVNGSGTGCIIGHSSKECLKIYQEKIKAEY